MYTDFAQLRRKVLEKAKAEIDQLAHFRVEVAGNTSRSDRHGAEFRFEPKGPPAVIETNELDRHASGRKARREGTVEAVTVGQAALTALAKALPSSKPEDKTFPRGSLHFGEDELLAIGRAHGGGWDINLIADAYREHMGARLEKPGAPR